MSTALTKTTHTTNEIVSFTDEQIDTLRRTICNELTNDELQLFTMICTKHGLDPFSRQIYALKSGRQGEKKLTPITSIDGFRLIAQRSGQYAGQHAPQWTADGQTWVDAWLDAKPPAAARVSVLRHDWAEPMTVVYTWQEYTGGQASYMQKKMPAHMLAKATEALALRKAFPNELSGLYTNDEIPADTVDVQSNTPVARKQVERKPSEPLHVVDAETVEVVAPQVAREDYDAMLAAIKNLDGDGKNQIKMYTADNGIRFNHAAITKEQYDAVCNLIVEIENATESEPVDVEPSDVEVLANLIDAAQE